MTLTTTTTRETTAFLPAFRTRRELCRALLALTQEQSGLIVAEDLDDLLSLLQHKQQLLDALLLPDAETARLLAAWRTHRDNLSPADRAACESLLADAETLLHSALACESRATAQLSSLRDHTAVDLQSIQTAARLHHGYLSASQTPSATCLDCDL
jgi:hypothetical protein